MASVFGHAFSAVAIGTSFSKKMFTWKFFLLGVLCAIIPDADILAFSFDIAYGDFWGHRGFTHSFVFALMFGTTIAALFYHDDLFSRKGLLYILFFTLCTASHSIFDAMTTGGLGVAFFSPFDNTRYFLPWRPIRVSPIGASRFFSEWGMRVLFSEMIWIGIPCTIYMLFTTIIRAIRR